MGASEFFGTGSSSVEEGLELSVPACGASKGQVVKRFVGMPVIFGVQ
jgi:hypothetical protein